jgi:hypothetical protein
MLGRRGVRALPVFVGAFVCKLKAFGENNGCTFQKNADVPGRLIKYKE